MSVLLEKICIDPIFDKAKILAGKAGICRRIVHRVSVFDCPYHKNIAEEGIIDKGDLFISCLEQFEVGSPEVRKSIEGLINRQAAGLIIVPSAKVEVLDFEILELCDKEEFPIILIKEEKPYAYIMSVVNGYISIEMENAINLLRLEKIRFGNLTSKEKMDMLYSINRNIQKNVMTIYVKGDFLRKWFSAGIWDNQIKNKQDTLVVGDYLIVILSNDDRKKLEQGIKAMLSQLRQLFPSAYFGLSRIYQVKDIKRILDEGENALKIAMRMKIEQHTYDPLMPMQLFLAMSGCREEQDFYNAYLEAISKEVSVDMLPEILRTVEIYVYCDGNYKKTAEYMHQHENTVRYRLNIVKKALKMEDNKIFFLEILAIATQIGMLLGEQ